MQTTFNDFRVGDRLVFQKRFVPEDFGPFHAASGDGNPLHHDQDYANASGFAGPIVPLHMLAAPLSRIAGMHLPGESSLYLGHEVRAVAPVRFGELLTYSARVAAINLAARVLTITVLVLRGSEVVMEATMRTSARHDAWERIVDGDVQVRPEPPPAALVTGAGGAIGAAICHRLVRMGWRVLAVQREGEPPPRTEPIIADLLDPRQVEAVVAAARSAEVTALVHAASPPWSAAMADLLAVNHTALRTLAEGVLPDLLARQRGTVLGIGTTALFSHPRGMEDYVSAKAAMVALLAGIDHTFGRYGVRGIVLSPHLVRTPYSTGLRAADDPALLPEEVADSVADMLGDPPRVAHRILRLDGIFEHDGAAVAPTGAQRSETGSSNGNTQPTHAGMAQRREDGSSDGSTRPAHAAAAAAPSSADALAKTVRSCLGLPAGAELDAAALGVTPGWDSLRHIELMLAVEREHGIRIEAGDFERTKTYRSLQTLVEGKST